MYEPRFLNDLKEEYHDFDVKTMREIWEHENHPIIFPARNGDLMCRYKEAYIDLTMLGLAKYPSWVIKRTMQRMATLCDHNGGYLIYENYEDLKAYAELEDEHVKKKSDPDEEPDSDPDEITIGDRDSEKPRRLKDVTFKPHYIGSVRSDKDIPKAFDEKGEKVFEYEVRPVVYTDPCTETLWMRFGLLFWDLSKIGVDRYPAKILGMTLIQACNVFLMTEKSPNVLEVANEYSIEMIRRIETIIADKIEKGFVDSKFRDNLINIELKKELIDDAEDFWFDSMMPPTCIDRCLPSLSLSDYSETATALARDFMEKHKSDVGPEIAKTGGKFYDPVISKEDLRKSLSKAFVASLTPISPIDDLMRPMDESEKLKWTELLKDGTYTTYVGYADTDKLSWTEEWATTSSTSGDASEYVDCVSTTGEYVLPSPLGYNYGKATNGYWLATLPADKLATYFACTTNCDRCKFCHDPYNCADGANCEKGIKLWLEEEYKDETGDE